MVDKSMSSQSLVVSRGGQRSPLAPLSLVGDTVTFLDHVLQEALKSGSSDVHFEPYEKSSRIRLRQDGILHEWSAIALCPQYEQVVSRIKVLARLDIAEKRVPQDGRMKLQLGTQWIDIRVSTLPTVFGEKVVLRLLDNSAQNLVLDNLGFSQQQARQLEQAIHRPHGMVLATGPTGSGKTATLYTCLRLLNQTERNICTIEDPVEIYLHGINQVQVNEKTNLNFVNAMRAFLRQDPDVMMVGEIRDEETADIAIKAAQTGHLVLSTLHTNDAASALIRLLHMGVADYLLAASVNLICAQRLLRKLCRYCRLPDVHGFYQANSQGCTHCHLGYMGRTGIFQLLPITTEIQNTLLEKASLSTLQKILSRIGVVSLHELAMEKVRAGITSLAEASLHTMTNNVYSS
jgi:type IV pilus assembly protein PilB